jgi:hypothetical protein
VEIIEGEQTSITLRLKKLPRSGRLDLILAATVSGAVMGSGLAAMFDTSEEIVGVAGPLGLGLGFGSAYLGVPGDIAVGKSSYLIGSTLIGAVQGGLVASLFGCNTVAQPDMQTQEQCDGTTNIAGALAGSASGLLFSILTAERFAPEPGDAAVINSGAMWGSVSGGLFWLVFNEKERLRAPMLLGGLNIGIATGVILARRTDISRSHMALIDVAGGLGMLVGGAIADVVDQDEGISERIPHFALLGMGVGLISGAYLTRNMDEPASLKRMSPTMGTATDAGGQRTMTLGVMWPF